MVVRSVSGSRGGTLPLENGVGGHLGPRWTGGRRRRGRASRGRALAAETRDDAAHQTTQEVWVALHHAVGGGVVELLQWVAASVPLVLVGRNCHALEVGGWRRGWSCCCGAWGG